MDNSTNSLQRTTPKENALLTYQLRECVAKSTGIAYLFHTWLKKNTADGEVLIAIVEDIFGVLHEIKSDDIKFIKL